MYRSIHDYLSSKASLTSQQKYQLCQYLQNNFFRPFKTTVDLDPIISCLQTHEFKQQAIIFQQGEIIERYYFLVDGRIILQRKGAKYGTKEGQLIQADSIIGQYFYDLSPKRTSKAGIIPEENSALVLSISCQDVEKHYFKQMKQYGELQQKMSYFTSVSSQNLDQKGMFRHISYHKYRFGDEINTKTMANNLGIILTGQCILKHSGSVSLVSGDYINLEKYFHKNEQSKGKTICTKYRVTSSQMEVCLLSFQFVDKLSEQFREQLLFIYQCHQDAPTSFLNHSSLNNSALLSPKQQKQLLLPRVKRQITFTRNNHTINILRQLSPRKSYNEKRKFSILEDKQNEGQTIEEFRKAFCLGYSGPKQLLVKKVKKKIGEPKGYFQLPSFRRKITGSSFQFHRKQWSTYINQKSRQKYNKKQMDSRQKSKSKQFISSASALKIQEIINKYSSKQYPKHRLFKTRSQFLKTKFIEFPKK